jgi:hypothetical protein
MTPHDVLDGPPVAGTEIAMLLGALERNRRTFAWKCGPVKHLALVEDDSFTRSVLARDLPAPWETADFDTDPDWEWRTAVERSRAAIADALADGGLDARVRRSEWAEPPSLRRVLVDMIEEYARHTGHADLIRESVDGLVGEDAPR